jgi:hypothetical protein
MTIEVTQHSLAGNAFRALLLLSVLGVLAALAIDQRLLDRFAVPQPSYEITLEGQRFRVDGGTAEAMARQSRGRADLGSARARLAVSELLERELDSVFGDLSARVPDYADWYFSLTGEYARLSMLILQQIGLQDRDYLWERADGLIFNGGEFVDRLVSIEHRVESRLGVHAREQQTAWMADLLQLLVPGHEAVGIGPAPVATLSLDDLAVEFGGHGSSEFLTRISASSAGAGSAGLAAPILARMAARSAAAGLVGGSVAAKSATRGAARAGGAGASVLGCAAAGPAALACAAVVGGAAWVATDWALLSVDEWRHRDALIADWEQRLDRLRMELEAAMLAHYDQAIDAWREGMETEVERTFSPLHSIRTSQ